MKPMKQQNEGLLYSFKKWKKWGVKPEIQGLTLKMDDRSINRNDKLSNENGRRQMSSGFYGEYHLYNHVYHQVYGFFMEIL